VDPLTALADLVAFPTVSDRPLIALAAWLAERAQDAGMRVERFETSPGKCNVLARIGPQDTDGLLLCGHMDVVPVAGQDWSSDPFHLDRRGDRLYGRGACDMKAFLAATTCALAELPLQHLDRELVLAWTHDEEVGCHGSRALLRQLDQVGGGLPSLALIGEPTNFEMCRAHPGHTTLKITCTGRAAHSSRPGLGTSAVRIAADILDALDRLQEELAAEDQDVDPQILDALPTPYPVLNCGQIHGGTAVNIVPDRCELLVGLRQLPGQSGHRIFNRVQALVDSVALRWARQGGGASAEILQEAPALLTPAGTELERLLRPHASSDKAGAAAFATDGGNLALAGVHSIVFGPGSIDVAHRADEYVPVDQLWTCQRVVSDIVRRRCMPMA